MTNSENHRDTHEATPEQLERSRAYRSGIAGELPELRDRAREIESSRREAAMREPTVSGQLRRAIAESGYDRRELAAMLDIPGKALPEFLIGTNALDSSTIDQLAALLKQELKPIG